jgi:hypothetical protein
MGSIYVGFGWLGRMNSMDWRDRGLKELKYAKAHRACLKLYMYRTQHC